MIECLLFFFFVLCKHFIAVQGCPLVLNTWSAKEFQGLGPTLYQVLEDAANESPDKSQTSHLGFFCLLQALITMGLLEFYYILYDFGIFFL